MVDRAIGLCECEIVVIGSRNPHQHVALWGFISLSHQKIFQQYLANMKDNILPS